MNPNMQSVEAFNAGVRHEQQRREAQCAQSRASQPKRKNTRKGHRR